MPLKMVQPTKHPKTGVYRLRGRYRPELAAVYGRTEWKVSLGTKDKKEAVEKAPAVLARLTRTWKLDSIAHARVLAEGENQQPLELDRRQIETLASEFYAAYVKQHEDHPGPAEPWRRKLADQMRIERTAAEGSSMRGFQLTQMRWSRPVRSYLEERGLVLTVASTQLLTASVSTHMRAAFEHILRQAIGDYREDKYPERFPKRLTGPEKRTLDAVFERYADEHSLAASTRKRFKAVLRKFLTEQVRRDDFGAITEEDVGAWKTRLLDRGLAVTTVRNVYIAAIKATCNWAVAAKIIPKNPTAAVRVPEKNKTARLRDQKGFTKREAEIVLRAAAETVDEGRLPADRYAARRWVPWICAYTGARVNEITPVRVEDIIAEDAGDDTDNVVWMIRITPEAGPNKGNAARKVPLHDHLIEQGFLDFVRSVRTGPLFYDPGRARGGSAAHPIYKKTGERLAAWVRSLGIVDRELAPNHGWRHRFRSACLAQEIEEAVIKKLMGHAAENEAEKYGDVWPSTAKAAIDKLPRFKAADPMPNGIAPLSAAPLRLVQS